MNWKITFWVLMPFFRPEIRGANSKRNAQFVLIPPILTRYSEHLKNKIVGIWATDEKWNRWERAREVRYLPFWKERARQVSYDLWKKKKKGKAKYKADFCLVCNFLKFRIKDSTHRFVFGSHSADLPLRISSEVSEST